MDKGPRPSESVGTVSVSPSTSPPNFPLGSQETEVKVAAGALGAGQFGSRWVSIPPPGPLLGRLPLQAGGLVVRSGEGLPMEMRAWGNYGVEAPDQRKGSYKGKSGGKQAGDSLGRALASRAGPGPLFKAVRSFLPVRRAEACSG